MEIIEPPPEMKSLVEETARMFSVDPKYEFLRNPDHPYYAFYQQKLKEYNRDEVVAAPPPNQDKDIHRDEVGSVPKELYEYFAKYRAFLKEPVVEPHKFGFRELPQGMTAKELDIWKLTAHFVVRYGLRFWYTLLRKTTNDPRFEFVQRVGQRDGFFWDLRRAYMDVVKVVPGEKTLKENPAYMALVFEGFFHFVKRIEEKDYERSPQEMDLNDWHAFMCGHEWEDYADNPSEMMMKRPMQIQLSSQFDRLQVSPPTPSTLEEAPKE